MAILRYSVGMERAAEDAVQVERYVYGIDTAF